MQRSTLLTWGVVAVLVASLYVGFSERNATAKEEAAKEQDWAATARKAWVGTCRKCHTVPDATFETGRAFLAQITETS